METPFRAVPLALACSLVWLGACTNNTKPLLANLAGAVSVGVTKGTAIMQGLMGASVPGSGQGQPPIAFSKLVKVDASGNTVEVLDQSMQVWYTLVTPTHVLATGNFNNIADATTGKGINCNLIAIPKTAAGEPVKCLVVGSDVLVADSNNQTHTQGVVSTMPPPDKTGIVALGSDVYFAQQTGMANPNGFATELRHWASGADTTDLLIHFNAGGGTELFQPFVAPGAPNLCVLAMPLGAGSSGPTLCGAIGANNWMDVMAPVRQGAVSGPPVVGVYQIGTSVVVGGNGNTMTPGHVVDLASGAVTSINVDDADIPAWTQSTTTTDGRVLGIQNPTNALLLLDAMGPPRTIDKSVAWTNIIGDGAYAWVYGSSKLQRFDRTSATLDPTNYLGMTTLLQVTDMSYSTGGRIRLDGTLTTGQPGIVAIDTQSGAITVTSEDLPRLAQVTPLQ